MTPKQRREKLFKGTKPRVRKIQEDDWKWLYGAYRYPEPPKDEEDFHQFQCHAAEVLAGYDDAYIIEDRHKKFRGNYGPIGLTPVMYNGWTLEPHVQWFPWATTLNRVRGTVAFLMFARYSNEIGVTVVKSLEEHKNFFKGLKKFVPLYYVNKIPYGDHRGDLHLFYVRGKKQGARACHS